MVTLFVNVRDHSIKLQIGYFYIKQHYTDFAQLAQNVTGQIEIFEASFSTSISTTAAQQGGRAVRHTRVQKYRFRNLTCRLGCLEHGRVGAVTLLYFLPLVCIMRLVRDCIALYSCSVLIRYYTNTISKFIRIILYSLILKTFGIEIRK